MTAADAVPGFAGGLFSSAQNPRAARLRVQWSVRDFGPQNCLAIVPDPSRSRPGTVPFPSHLRRAIRAGFATYHGSGEARSERTASHIACDINKGTEGARRGSEKNG